MVGGPCPPGQPAIWAEGPCSLMFFVLQLLCMCLRGRERKAASAFPSDSQTEPGWARTSRCPAPGPASTTAQLLGTVLCTPPGWAGHQ